MSRCFFHFLKILVLQVVMGVKGGREGGERNLHICVILLFICQLWNIQISGQYLNCDSTKALKIVFLFSNVKNFDILAKTVGFLLALEQILETCLSNFSSLSIVTPKSFTSTLSYISSPPTWTYNSSCL